MNEIFQVGDIVKVKSAANRNEMYRRFEVISISPDGRIYVSWDGGYQNAPAEYFELVRSAPPSYDFTEQEVKSLCEKAWNAGIDYTNDDSDFPMGPSPHEKESPNFEQFWNANKPQ